MTNKNQNTHVRNKHVSESMISLHAQHFVLKKPKGPRTDREVKRSQRDRIFVCSGQGAMDEAPNLEGSIAALLLRVARLEDQLRQMDLPFVEDRLDNMETVVAALQRTIDTLSERFEVLLTLARGLEASIRSLERERRSMLILADRISQLESISRQEHKVPWSATRSPWRTCVIASHALKQHLSSVMIDFWCARHKHLLEISKNGRSLIAGSP